MLKNIIAPVQAWLMSQNRCVGCGMPLSGGLKMQKNGQEMVKCKCQRVYIYDKAKSRYLRALVTEI